jgi:hypothetical protein
MSTVFVIQNQQGQFLSRQKEWLGKTEINALYKTPHRDLAVNELFEISFRDTETRAQVVEAEASNKGLPLVADLPPLEFPSVELPEDLPGVERAADSVVQSDHQGEQTCLELEPATAALETTREQAPPPSTSKPTTEPTTEQV